MDGYKAISTKRLTSFGLIIMLNYYTKGVLLK